VKILAVDDHPLIREGLARVVTEIGPDVEVIPADCVSAALAHFASTADLSLTLLKLRLPDTEGMDGLERLHAARPEVPVIVFSALANLPATVRALITAGAMGVLSNRCTPRVLLEALRLVLAGGVYVPPEAFGSERSRQPAQTPASLAAPPAPRRIDELGLTPRQTEVLALLAQGKPNKLICRSLDLAEGTVKTHAAAIYQALGVSNRTEALFAMNRLGIQLPSSPSLTEAGEQSHHASLQGAPRLPLGGPML
jgi:DNA-binding NarL/FixJ family response regulator